MTYLVFILPVFGSMSVIPPELIGGSSILPGFLAAVFLIAKTITSRGVLNDVKSSLTDFHQLGFLCLFLVIAIIGSYVLPRVFEGTIHVYSIHTAQLGFVAPSMANYTQAGYLTISTILTATIAALAKRNPNFITLFCKATLWGAYATIATGLLYSVAVHVGGAGLLSVFYTANYGTSSGEIMGSTRVIGLMPEPSSYGGMAAGFCAMLLFLRPAFPTRLWRFRVPMTAWACGLLALLSLSSTAYAMMAVVLALYTLYSTHKITSDGTVIKKTLSKKFLALIGAGVLVLVVLLFDTELADLFTKMVEVLLFEKSKTTSYIERSSWTAAGLNAFLESYGLGVGAGSVRTSNFFVNVLASTGIIGGCLFLSFLWVIFTRKASQTDARANALIRGTKFALVPMLVGLALIGTTPDFGIMPGVLFGLIVGLSTKNQKAKWISPHLNRRKHKNTNPLRP